MFKLRGGGVVNFKGKKFEYVEIAEDIEGFRNNFIKLSDAEKLTWNYKYKKQAWRSIYTYPEADFTEYSFAGYYFESDITDFELNRKIILSAVGHLNVNYEIPFEAFKFKFTNKSIWVEIAPSVMGIKPTKNLSETFRGMTLSLNKTLSKIFGVSNPLDINVYSPRQLVRLTGSFLPKTSRYVIDLNYWEIGSLTYKEIIGLSYKKRKITHFGNCEFLPIPEAVDFYKKHTQGEQQKTEKPLFEIVTEKKQCIENFKELGVSQGQRNNALFYTAIQLKNEGLDSEACFNALYDLNLSFDQHKVDGLSKIKATVRSVYKSDYRFSCRKMREVFPDHCSCDHCPHFREIDEKVFKIYKNQLLFLFNTKSKKAGFKALLKKSYGKTPLTEKESALLKKMPLTKGSFHLFPSEGFEKIYNMDSEIILFFKMIKSSPNGHSVNPKMTVKHYANHLETSERSIQRYMSLLETSGFISHGEIVFAPKSPEVVLIDDPIIVKDLGCTEKQNHDTKITNKENQPEILIYKDTG